MRLSLRYENRDREARKTHDRRRSGDRRRTRFQLEPLEGRQMLSWASVPVQPATAHAPLDPIQREYAATAFEKDAYGNKVQNDLGPSNPKWETNVPGVPRPARMEKYKDNGAIYWSGYKYDKAHVVYGAIGAEYAATAFEKDAYGNVVQLDLGLPNRDEVDVPGVPGPARMNTFATIDPLTRALNGAISGAIYWSPSTGAHVVYGAIGAEYAATAFEKDAYGNVVQTDLGLPTSDEMDVPGVPGARMNTFQGGAIYWSSSTGAHVVYGAIGAEYIRRGGPTSFLGLPSSDEADSSAFPGFRVTYFGLAGNVAILWSAATGAFAV